MVEHATENRSVGGSIPPLGTIQLSAAVRAIRTKTRPGVARRAKPDGSIPLLGTVRPPRKTNTLSQAAMAAPVAIAMTPGRSFGWTGLNSFSPAGGRT